MRTPCRRLRRSAGLVVMGLAMTGLTACGDEGEPVSEEKSAEVLETQRLEVRSAISELVGGAAESVGGRSTGASGQFRGCVSSGPESFESFQYRATARIDVGPDVTRPYLDALSPVLEAAGFDASRAGERPSGRTLSATRDGVEASFSELPSQGDYVLVTVAGPCVDVPRDESDRWLDRSDRDPID